MAALVPGEDADPSAIADLDEMEEEVGFELPCNTCFVQTMLSLGKGGAATIRKREREMDMSHDVVLLGLDPGGTTGWAMLVIGRDALMDPEIKILNNIALYTWGEIKGNEHEQVDAIEQMLDVWPGACVVREDFILRTSNKSRETLSPVRLGFGIDHLLYTRGRGVFTQQPALAKTTATDERLRDWGLYRPGSEHARDATRHAITFARRAKMDQKLLLQAWPHLSKKRRNTK